jgi:uncharacterized membrane protein YbhN (UPF0104 family)
VVFAIGPVLLLAHTLPISIGGWGVREAAAVALLGMTGVDATSALLVSIMFGVLLVLATLPGALFWLMLREPAHRDDIDVSTHDPKYLKKGLPL